MIKTAKFIYPFIESLTDAIIKEGKNPTATKFKEKKSSIQKIHVLNLQIYNHL